MCTTKCFVTISFLQRLDSCAGGGGGGRGGGGGGGGERTGKYAFLPILAGFTRLIGQANVFTVYPRG